LKESTTKYKRRWEKLKKEKEAWGAEKGNLRHQSEEAHSKVEAEVAGGAERAVNVEHEDYKHRHKDRAEFFRKFLITLAPDSLRQEGYFKVYVKYIKDRRQARAEGRNPKLVDFLPPVLNENGQGDKETMPLRYGRDSS